MAGTAAVADSKVGLAIGSTTAAVSVGDNDKAVTVGTAVSTSTTFVTSVDVDLGVTETRDSLVAVTASVASLVIATATLVAPSVVGMGDETCTVLVAASSLM